MELKVETILLSAINRLYDKESKIGLDYDDLKAFEIITKITKDYSPGAVTAALKEIEMTPDNILELIKKAAQKPDVG